MMLDIDVCREQAILLFDQRTMESPTLSYDHWLDVLMRSMTIKLQQDVHRFQTQRRTEQSLVDDQVATAATTSSVVEAAEESPRSTCRKSRRRDCCDNRRS